MKKNYIILPFYNDWRSLKKVLANLDRSLKNEKSDNNIVIVNDCSLRTFKKDKKYKSFKSFKVLDLKKNVGSQKAIFFGLKYLQKKIRNKKKDIIISVLDSDGEDNPFKLKQMINLASNKKGFFIFASRKARTEGIIFRFINQLRLIITYFLTGKFINVGNFSSFSSSILSQILSNDNLYLAYSSGVLKNYNKFYFLNIKKNKRYYDNSKVNLKFLIIHSLNILAVFYKNVLFRSLLLILLTAIFLKNLKIKIFIMSVLIILNIILIIKSYSVKIQKKGLSTICNLNNS